MTIQLRLTMAAMLLIACGPNDLVPGSLGVVTDDPAVELRVEAADVVYRNGRIYTVNMAEPWAEAVAITDENRQRPIRRRFTA